MRRSIRPLVNPNWNSTAVTSERAHQPSLGAVVALLLAAVTIVMVIAITCTVYGANLGTRSPL